MNHRTMLSAAALIAAAAFAVQTLRAAETKPAAAAVQLISTFNATDLYSIEYNGHACFLASTRGGSGVTLQCPK